VEVKLQRWLFISYEFITDFNSQPTKFPYKAVTHALPINKETFDDMVSDLNEMIAEFTEEFSTLDAEITSRKEILESVLNNGESSSDAFQTISQELSKLESQSLELSVTLQNVQSLLPPFELYELVLKNPRLVSVYQNYAQYDPVYLDEALGILEPKFTHFTADFRFTLDYIFQLDGQLGLIPTQLLRLPNPDLFGPGLPTPIHPSDHLPIMARFEWLST